MSDAIEQRFLAERIVFVGAAIDDAVADKVVANLLALKKGGPIRVYINSPGGSVTASLAVRDAMAGLDVATFAIGQAAGTALLLLASGTRGKRFALPHARLAFTEVWGGGKSAEGAAEVVRLKRELLALFAAATGRPLGEIEAAYEARRHFSGDEAVAFGLVDAVVQSLPE